MRLNKVKLYVDSAEPRSIEFLRKEGYNAQGAQKGKDSVKAGLMFLQDCHLVVRPSCKNFITELENFSYITMDSGIKMIGAETTSMSLSRKWANASIA